MPKITVSAALLPFHTHAPETKPLTLRGSLQAEPAPASNSLSLHVQWQIQGLATASPKLLLPLYPKTPSERYQLWEATCFELFIASPTSEHYVEWNFALPHFYYQHFFVGYRQPLASGDAQRLRSASPTPQALQSSYYATADVWELTTQLSLPKATIDFLELQETALVGISCILVHPSPTEQKSYWAFAHPQAPLGPDFHARQTWCQAV